MEEYKLYCFLTMTDVEIEKLHANEPHFHRYHFICTWRILGTVEPDGLLSMGSHRVGHD